MAFIKVSGVKSKIKDQSYAQVNADIGNEELARLLGHGHDPSLFEGEGGGIKKQLTFSAINKAWFSFWTKLPHRIWQFHIESLIIPSYRHEWGKYITWNSHYPLRPHFSGTKESKRKRRELNRRRKMLLEESMKPQHSPGCQRLTFNIAGTRFQTQERTVGFYPNSLLGNPEKRSRFFVPEKGEYFFDRHAESFEAILHLFQTKGTMLNRPSNVPLPVFEDEMSFYQMGPDLMERLRAEEGFYKESTKSTPKNLFARKVWLLFEFPESSKQAQVVAIISIFVVIVSIILLCLETLGPFQERPDSSFDAHDAFFQAETIAISWFCIELIARFVCCHRKVRFMKDYMNIIDLVAILPYFFETAMELFHVEGSMRQNATVQTLRVIRLVRVLRIFKLSRHSKGLKVLGLTLHASLRELILLLFFLTIGVILFSAAVFYAESAAAEESQFASIPGGFSWAVGTMTTLGYGDVVPITFWGKLVGSACAVAGVLTLSLPVPVIVSNFNYFSHREIDQEDLHEQRSHVHHVDVCPCLPECEFKRDHDHSILLTRDHDDMNFLARNALPYVPLKRKQTFTNEK